MQPRSLNLHQRDKAVNLRLLRRKLREDAAQAQGVFAKSGTHPIFARSRGVAFVENQVDHFQNRGQSRSQLLAAGNLKGNARFRKRALGANDTLGNSWFRNQEGAGDFLRGQAAEQAKRECDTRFGG